jgi:PAS domain S-box-containing protein
MSKQGNRLEEALTSSEQELRLLVETIPALVWRAGPEGNIEYVSKRVLDYFGASLDEVIGWGWMDKVHPDDVAFKVRTWLQNLESGKPHDAVCRFRAADGRYRWFEVRAEPLRAGDGEVLSWFGVLIDIDDRKKAEEALRESEYKLRHIIDTEPGLIWSTGPEERPRFLTQLQATLNLIPAYTWYAAPSGGITFVNKRTADYLGLPKDHPLRFGIDTGAQWDAHIGLLHPDDQEQSRKAWSTCLRSGKAAEFSQRVRNAQGGYRWFLSRAEPLRASDGTLLLWVGVNLDIAELKRAEQALRESEYKLRQIIETVPSLLWSLGPAGEPTYANQRILDYVGVRLEDFKNHIWQRFLHPDDLTETVKAFDHAIQTGTSYEAVHRLRLADGEYRWHHVRGEPLRDGEGRVVQWYGVSIDINERKKAEDQLRRSEAYLAEAQRLSHTGSAAYNDTTLLYWSDENYRIFGFDPREGLPSREAAVERIHPDDREQALEEGRRAVREKRDYKLEYRLLLPDGSIKHIESTAHPKFSASGELVEIFNTIIDVTERKCAEEERKKAEERLRLSEARLAEAQRLSHSGVAAYDETTILYGSEETYRIWGFDPTQGVPSREAVNQRIHPDDRARVLAEVQRAVGERRDYSIEYRIVLPDGTAKNLESIGRPRFSTSGELVEIVVTHLDVTERKCAEEALRESEQRFRDYAQTASDWYWETDADHKFTRITDYERLLALGFAPMSRIGLTRWDYATDVESEPEKWELHRSLLEARQPFRDFVYRAARSDGSLVFYKASGKPIYDAKGAFLGYRGTGADVTDRKRAEEERKKAEERLRLSEARLAEAQRLSQTGSWAWSPDEDIRYWSDECYRVLSFDPQDGLPRFEEFFQRIHPDDQPGFREVIQTAIREKAEWEADYRIVHQDDPVRDIHVVGHPVLSTSGHLVEFVGTVIDVTERRRAEKERARLRQLEADLAHINRVSTLGEMAASLAHEITQPIAAARNNARAALNFLEQQPPDLIEVGEALGCVVGDADRAGLIVDRIRDHIKKAPPRKHRFDLNEAINEVIVLARSAIAENGVMVQTRLMEGLTPVEGDRVQLQQVILNLALNAAEAMSAVDEGTRELLISTEQTRTNGVFVAVRDSGPGINPENIERVFDAFYTTKSSGVGMGLSICRSIIEAHGGRLWADANKPKGAVFQFTLPNTESSRMG